MANHQNPKHHMDEAEKPFWISYSDLMTALMILFLVVMVASLTSISQQAIQIKTKGLEKNPSPKPTPEVPTDTPEAQELKKFEIQRLIEVQSVCSELTHSATQQNIAARINCQFNRIDFGEAGRFDSGQYKLNSQGEQTLKDLVPVILKVAQSPMGEKWLRRIHIQGFTDTDGSYLYNLNLSLKRSEWVMCKILSTDPEISLQLTPEQRNLVKQLFQAGGVSFNNAQSSKEASRRIELQLEFYEMDAAGQPEEQNARVLFQDSPQERCRI